MPRRVNTSNDLPIAELYRQSFSAPEIAKKLNIPLHSIYDSLVHQNIRRRDKKDQHKIRFERSPLSFKFKEVLTPNQRELLIAGIMLYYGEGAKTGNTVDFANSDVKTLLIFIRFLRNICSIDPKKLRCYLYCFTNQDVGSLINFWSKTLKVPKLQFTKPYVRTAIKSNKRVMNYGVLHIRYSDKRLLKKILDTTSKISDSLL